MTARGLGTRTRWLRAVGVAAFAGLVTLSFAGPAQAGPGEQTPAEAAADAGAKEAAKPAEAPVTGTVKHVGGSLPIAGTYKDGNKVVNFSDKVGHLELTAGSEKSYVFCIDIKHPLSKLTYTSAGWDKVNVGTQIAKIQWVLQNSYPKNPAEKVLADAGVGDVQGDKNLLVYAATQAAVWHFSDGFTLTKADENIKKVYTHLTSKAVDLPEPKNHLKLSPEKLSGTVGAKVGPFTIDTTSDEVTLTAEGGKVVDKDGKELSKAKGGDKFWVISDKVGSATVNAAAKGAKVPSGRIFIRKDAQKLVLAKDLQQEDLKAKVTVDFAAAQPTPSPSAPVTPAPTSPAPGPGLPVTGTSTPILIGTGAVLLAAGAGFVYFFRRRRANFTV